ncbi:uncharacterized protein LOC126265732 [Aethina tumida]|uniref:uncharacterized protein LOC126265732 n=1 Tax=Aethina tumida TaxID=116153 RepID=UPI0021493870|nr:uncharacterized protein LOC126265732 [Aethina tumida]
MNNNNFETKLFSFFKDLNIMAPTEIVDEVLTIEEIKIENHCLRDFPESKKEMMEWLARRGLIKNHFTCDVCDIPMSLNKYSGGIDGFRWKCRLCTTRKSIRHGSFFANSKLSLLQSMIIIYCWSIEMPHEDIEREAHLGSNSTHTIVDWCSFWREICEVDLINNPNVIGGFDEETLEPKTVEIDESKFSHRKYNRGRWTEGKWVFGGIERGTGKCFLVEVPDRTTATLHEMIQRFECISD